MIASTRRDRRAVAACLVSATLVVAGGIGGCPPDPGTDAGLNPPDSTPLLRNTSDPTNAGADYVGATGCAACHRDLSEQHARHGHAQALRAALGAPPRYPDAADDAGVPTPPAGLAWNDVAYVIGGYLHGGVFVDSDGFLLTDARAGAPAAWRLARPGAGQSAGFVSFAPDAAEPVSFDFECFRCHTTGPQSAAQTGGVSQGGRSGISGVWFEDGVQCEACHGPGGNHVPNPSRRDLFVDTRSERCAECHTGGLADGAIPVVGGFVHPYAQSEELRASGGHAEFQCTVCHDAHASSRYDRDRGIRNACLSCHSEQNMAFHGAFTFRVGDHEEPLTCESCHMPFSGRSVASIDAAIVGDEAAIGDVRGHIFRIDSSAGRRADVFSAGGALMRLDSQGRAALSLDFVCLRCHNGSGNAFPISADGAPSLTGRMHQNAGRAESLGQE